MAYCKLSFRAECYGVPSNSNCSQCSALVLNNSEYYLNIIKHIYLIECFIGMSGKVQTSFPLCCILSCITESILRLLYLLMRLRNKWNQEMSFFIKCWFFLFTLIIISDRRCLVWYFRFIKFSIASKYDPKIWEKPTSLRWDYHIKWWRRSSAILKGLFICGAWRALTGIISDEKQYNLSKGPQTKMLPM